jgi:hypothetical protein
MAASKSILGGVAAAVVVAVLVGIAWRSQRTLERGLPPRIECTDKFDAHSRARAHIINQGGTVVGVLGTGSMAPYIPAARAGLDPMATIVAFAVTQPGATIKDVRKGKLCTYRPEFASESHYIHGAAEEDGLGWIMSGLNNERSESSWRMTAANFTGLVVAVFVWPEAAQQ